MQRRIARPGGLLIGLAAAWSSACGASKPSVSSAGSETGAGVLSNGTSACGYVDTTFDDRASCRFAARALPRDTLGDTTKVRTAIEHVIVIVQENHSLDNMFGATGHGIDGLPQTASSGFFSIAPYHLSALCTPDLPHDYPSMHAEYDGGRMDGFYAVGGVTAMGYYRDSDHPFYTWAATTFAFSDRYFSSVMGPTWPNRDYLLAGTSNGIKETHERALAAPTIFDELDEAGIAWADYNNGASPALETDLGWMTNPPQVKPYAALAGALASGVLEPVAFVDSGEDTHDEHPGTNGIDQGERFVADLVAQAFASPLWKHLAIFLTYDESGGFYDHVPPPSACLAAPSEAEFDRLGFRVPFLLISPYARAGYVSHQVHSHTSVLRFIENLFGLPALTGRDANSDALLDLFDFCKPSFPVPPPIVPATSVVSTCP